MKVADSRLKCRYCAWQIKPMWKNKNGRLVDGFTVLINHYLNEHDDKITDDQIRAVLDRGKEAKRLAQSRMYCHD